MNIEKLSPLLFCLCLKFDFHFAYNCLVFSLLLLLFINLLRDWMLFFLVTTGDLIDHRCWSALERRNRWSPDGCLFSKHSLAQLQINIVLLIALKAFSICRQKWSCSKNQFSEIALVASIGFLDANSPMFRTVWAVKITPWFTSSVKAHTISYS